MFQCHFAAKKPLTIRLVIMSLWAIVECRPLKLFTIDVSARWVDCAYHYHTTSDCVRWQVHFYMASLSRPQSTSVEELIGLLFKLSRHTVNANCWRSAVNRLSDLIRYVDEFGCWLGRSRHWCVACIRCQTEVEIVVEPRLLWARGPTAMAASRISLLY